MLLAPLLLDWGFLAPTLERAASRAIGRHIVIEGRIAVGLLPTPWVSATELHVTGAPTGDPLESASVERLEVGVALWPLLSRHIDIRAAKIDGVTLALRHPLPNEAPPTAPQASGEGWIPRAVSLRDGRATVDRLTWRAAPDLPAHVVEDLALHLTLETVGDTPATLAANVRASASVVVGAIEAAGETLTDVSGALAYEGDGLWTMALGAVRASGAVPLRIAAEAVSPARLLDGETVAFAVETTVGATTSRATGEATATLDVEPPALDIKLAFGTLDLSALGDGTAQSRTTDNRAIPAIALPQATVPDLALSFEATAERVALPGDLTLVAPSLRAALADGTLRVERFDSGLAGGRIGGSAAYTPADPPRAALRLQADGLNASAFIPRAGGVDLSGATLGITLDLNGAGPDTRALAAGLSGTAEVRMSGGAFRLQGASTLIRGLGPFLDPILGRNGSSPIRCVLARWRVTDGIAEMTGGVLDSRHLVASGLGRVNLRRETLDLAIGVRPRETSLVPLSVALQIGGTLSAPTVAAAPGDVLTKVATVAGVVVNPLGTIAVLAMGQNTQPLSCAAALEQGARAPVTPLGAIRGAVGDAASGAAGAIGGGLRSIFGR